MSTTLKTSLTVILLFLFTNSYAQNHDFKQCKYNKNYHPTTEGYACQACVNNNTKEREARLAEDKRVEEIKKAQAKAAKEAKDKAFAEEQKRKREEALKPKSGEVLINANLKSSNSNKSNPVPNLVYYKVIPEIPYSVKKDKRRTYRHEIKLNDKIVLTTNDYYSVDVVHGKKIFIGEYPLDFNIDCRNYKINNAVLFDDKNNIIRLNGINKFGFIQTAAQDSDDHFEIVVYEGSCSTIENDRYAKSRWATTRYKFSFSTMKLISKEESAQLDSCDCY